MSHPVHTTSPALIAAVSVGVRCVCGIADCKTVKAERILCCSTPQTRRGGTHSIDQGQSERERREREREREREEEQTAGGR